MKGNPKYVKLYRNTRTAEWTSKKQGKGILLQIGSQKTMMTTELPRYQREILTFQNIRIIYSNTD